MKLYLKAEQNSKVSKEVILLEDVAMVCCTNQKIENQIKKMKLYQIQKEEEGKICFSIMYIIKKLQQQYSELEIVNLGDTEFVVTYRKQKEEKMVWEWGKTIFVCFIIFFGGAFSIMTFNNDVSVADVFDKVYSLVMGKAKTGNSPLEIGYCIGLPIGIFVFFNHFRRKITKKDPTPIQIEMRKYEQDVNYALLQDADREGTILKDE